MPGLPARLVWPILALVGRHPVGGQEELDIEVLNPYDAPVELFYLAVDDIADESSGQIPSAELAESALVSMGEIEPRSGITLGSWPGHFFGFRHRKGGPITSFEVQHGVLRYALDDLQPTAGDLIRAVEANDAGTAMRLLRRGAPLHQHGRGAALWSAAYLGLHRLCESLLEHGADVLSMSAGGQHALLYALAGWRDRSGYEQGYDGESNSGWEGGGGAGTTEADTAAVRAAQNYTATLQALLAALDARGRDAQGYEQSAMPRAISSHFLVGVELLAGRGAGCKSMAAANICVDARGQLPSGAAQRADNSGWRAATSRLLDYKSLCKELNYIPKVPGVNGADGLDALHTSKLWRLLGQGGANRAHGMPAPQPDTDYCTRELAYPVVWRFTADWVRSLGQGCAACGWRLAVDAPGSQRGTILHLFARKGDPITTRLLVSMGAAMPPNGRDGFGDSPLHSAARAGFGDVIDGILCGIAARGQDITSLLEARNAAGRSVAELAASHTSTTTTIRCWQSGGTACGGCSAGGDGSDKGAGWVRANSNANSSAGCNTAVAEDATYGPGPTGWRQYAGSLPPLARDLPQVVAATAGPDVVNCEIEQIEAGRLSAAEFEQRYIIGSVPVLIRGAALEWPARARWTKARVSDPASPLGSQNVSKSAIPYEQDGNHSSAKFIVPSTLLSSYVRQLNPHGGGGADAAAPQYVFDQDAFGHVVAAGQGNSGGLQAAFDTDPVTADVKVPQEVPPLRGFHGHFSVQFALGPPGSGSPVHHHMDAWNGCVVGRKRWFIFPPGAQRWADGTMWEWYHKRYRGVKRRQNELGLKECVQGPGDVLFVPEGWAHGVLNLEETIAVAVEWDRMATSAAIRAAGGP